MNNVAYYHMNLTDNPIIWTDIFIEQMKYMDDSHLLQNLNRIKIVAITQDDERNSILQQLCSTYPVSFDILLVKNPFDNDSDMLYSRESNHCISETITLQKVWNDAKDGDYNILYLHTKGVSSYYNNVSQNVIDKHKQYYYWRQLMNWGVLEKWKDCVDALETHDTAGCNHLIYPSNHYCGNFWWTKSSHIRNLPDPFQIDWWQKLKSKNDYMSRLPLRYRDEMWICSNSPKSYDIVTIDPSIETFKSCLPKHKYEDALR